MAINPPSDIVLDVVKAADPASRKQAATRLAQIAGTPAPAPASFEEELAPAEPPARPAPPALLPFDAAGALVSMQNRHTLESAPASPYERFEAFVLQSFVEAMLPEDGTALFGKGTAGQVWKSMLAEGLGTQLARGGGIGIADFLSAAAERAEEEAARSAAPDAAATPPPAPSRQS